MTNTKYLIVGGGMTAAAAVDGIRDVDSSGGITMIGAEPDAPYDRPPLSKKLWKGKPLDMIWRKIEGKGVDAHLGQTITAVDPRQKHAVCSDGTEFTYEKLLLATGGRPRRLPFGGDNVIYFRTLSDYRRLRALSETGQKFAVIGGGFIGSEIAAALAMNEKKVTMVFPGVDIGEHVYPRDLAQFISGFYRQKGVEALARDQVTDVRTRGAQQVVMTRNGREIVVDGVVAGIGIDPSVELAQSAGIKVEGGIPVDEYLCAGIPDVYAAGDVASFHNPAMGKRIRVEHEDNANMMGRQAGRNMAGNPEPYHHLPYFYSDMFELGYEAIGELDSRLDTFADWKRPNEEGVIYYLRDGRVRGVLLWNVWDQVPAARKLIAEPGPFKPADLKGRLPA